MGRTFRKLAQIAAVAVAVLPSLVQAFIPSVSASVGSIHALVDTGVSAVVAGYDPQDAPSGNGGLGQSPSLNYSLLPALYALSYETVPNRYTFQGREYDHERGDYYFRNRVYVPEWGLFSGPDMNLAAGPYGEPHGLMSYVFCGNDPWRYADPMGLRNVVSDGRNVYQESGNWSDLASFRNLNAGGFYPARLPLDVAVECGIRPVSEWAGENTYATEFNGILPSGYLPYYRGKGLGSELVAGAYNVVPLLGNILCGGIDGMGGAFAASEEVCEDVTGCGSAELMMSMYQAGWVPGACAGAISYSLGVAGNTLRSIVPRVAMSAAIARGPALGSVESAAIRGGRPMVGDMSIPMKVKTYSLVKYEPWPTSQNSPHADGFLFGFRVVETAKKGQVFSRLGELTGQYVSPVGTSLSERGLPSGYQGKESLWQVIEPFEMESGLAGPWKDSSGFGKQHKLLFSIERLRRDGYLSPVQQ